ncbi:MAG TPA: GTP-binding protein [Bacteroidales bacterium]|nr:GTP-binding protein [Bacteroidales bacterium]
MTRLIFAGGFLGAGKTSLLFEATAILKKRGLTTGLITNDQATDLADTVLLGHQDVTVAEVAGSCFCCDFKGLRKAIEKTGKPEVIIAEPVGSCTDLSATLINPIRDMMKTDLSVGPLTVLADPARLKAIFEEDDDALHPAAAYIIKKQLEESDIIAISKTDLYTEREISEISGLLQKNFPENEIITISSKTNSGIESWLDCVLSRDDAGKHIPDIDYDRYAQGEAVLGWLNCLASLSGNKVNWDDFTVRLMKALAGEFDNKKLHVGHVKIIVENGDRYISANLTGKSETLTSRWSAGTGDRAEMILNARVEMPPEELQKLFVKEFEWVAGDTVKVHINRIRSISPGYPKPTYRYKK